jgi:hypothetical protein
LISLLVPVLLGAGDSGGVKSYTSMAGTTVVRRAVVLPL